MPDVEVYHWQDDSTRMLADPSGNVALMLTRLAAILGQLEAATVDQATWDGLTNAQRAAATRGAIRVVCRIARLTLGQTGTAP